MEKTPFLQEVMPGDHVCFGCGIENPHGLHIQSRWEGDECVCRWLPETKYNGWRGVLNGGIVATLIDCHCMATAMGAAYRAENREAGTQPSYGYATGTLTVKYLKPTPDNQEIVLRARVSEIKGRKTSMVCDVFAGELHTATAEVVAIRVIDTSKGDAFGKGTTTHD